MEALLYEIQTTEVIKAMTVLTAVALHLIHAVEEEDIEAVIPILSALAQMVDTHLIPGGKISCIDVYNDGNSFVSIRYLRDIYCACAN